ALREGRGARHPETTPRSATRFWTLCPSSSGREARLLAPRSFHARSEPEQGGPPRPFVAREVSAALAHVKPVGREDGVTQRAPERGVERLHRRLIFLREQARAERVAVNNLGQRVTPRPDRLPALAAVGQGHRAGRRVAPQDRAVSPNEQTHL